MSTMLSKKRQGTLTADAITVGTPRSTAGMTAPPRWLSHQQQDETQHANATQVSSSDESTSHARCTTIEDADLENFQVVVGDGAQRLPCNDSIHEHVMNTRGQEDIAFPAMTEFGTGTTPGDTAAVFIDTAQHGDRRNPGFLLTL